MRNFSYSRTAGGAYLLHDEQDMVIATIADDDAFRCVSSGIFDYGYSLFNKDSGKYEIGTLDQIV